MESTLTCSRIHLTLSRGRLPSAMSNDEDSDDDIPISQLRLKKSNGVSRVPSALNDPIVKEQIAAKSRIVKRASDEDAESDDDEEDDEEREGAKTTNSSDDDEEDDDDVPISELVKKRQAKVESSELHSQTDEDDDSDVPISELVKKKPAVKGANKRLVTEKKTKAVRKTQQNVDKSSPKKRKPTHEVLPAKKKKASGGNHEAVFYETLRGKLVQALLRRWWYAIEWPSKETREIMPDENFEELPAFPGVHICTSGPRLGEIVDHRNHSKSPCFTNFYAMPTEELKALVATAYDNQMKQLKEREPYSPLLTGLKKEMNEAARINAGKADVQARKAMITYENSTKARR